MNDFEFQKVNSRVIRSGDNYLAKVDSAENFSSIFVDEETTYGVSVRDAQIQTGDSTYTHMQWLLHIPWKMVLRAL